MQAQVKMKLSRIQLPIVAEVLRGASFPEVNHESFSIRCVQLHKVP